VSWASREVPTRRARTAVFEGASQDARDVITEANARYFGIELNDQSLVPGADSRIGPTHFRDWLNHLRVES
jgi:hypothetical protein